jgi:hypothetical protein
LPKLTSSDGQTLFEHRPEEIDRPTVREEIDLPTVSREEEIDGNNVRREEEIDGNLKLETYCSCRFF